ncbi:DMT family transporter [Aureimonas sp. ME7]|uniref:DMT family transporter n=1 Tax=Aureimonas sp. ME7 TaxID=2744252 RepID=UPI0015FCEB03|nr:DMT family transporter [Aureimonas sp. ME7]
MTSRNPLLSGILLTVLSGVVFATQDTIGKHLSTIIPVMQVVWGRYVVQTILMSIYLGSTGGTRFLRTSHPWLQIARGLLLLACTILMYEALVYVPLADATAVFFFSPIVVTLLSVAFLGERVGFHRIAAMGAGFAGMLLILRPGFSSFHPALLLVLLAAILNPVYLILTRHLAGREDAASTQFNTTAAGAVVMSLLVIPVWQMPDASTLALMLCIGTAGTVGHFLLVVAFSHGSASLLSPFLYSQVLTAAAASVLLFGDPLKATTAAGTAVLVGSGLYIWWRENRGRRKSLARPSPVEAAELHPHD